LELAELQRLANLATVIIVPPVSLVALSLLANIYKHFKKFQVIEYGEDPKPEPKQQPQTTELSGSRWMIIIYIIIGFVLAKLL
jgi:hypothetical protein